MYSEYCIYNEIINDYDKELSKVFKAIDYGVKGIAIPVYLIKQIQEYMPKDIVIAAPIDYPLGYNSSTVRKQMALEALRSGANALDYVPNHFFYKNKFTELSDEIKTLVKLCEEHNSELRVFLDYHRSSNIVNMSKIFHKLGVETVFPTLGYHHDDFSDNLINTKIIEDKTNLKVIFNGYLWKDDQLEALKASNISNIRFYNLKTLKSII